MADDLSVGKRGGVVPNKAVMPGDDGAGWTALQIPEVQDAT
jgi:hypothetical protein